MDRIRVLVCDDAEAFRALMRFSLQDDPTIEVVGEAADGEEGIRAVQEHQPDVVLLDLSMPLIDGMQAIPAMLERAPNARIIALSGFGADRMAERVLEQGAVAYLEKRADLQAIRDAIHAAAAA